MNYHLGHQVQSHWGPRAPHPVFGAPSAQGWVRIFGQELRCRRRKQ